MARCWTCGAHIERPLFTCPACRTVKEIQGLRKEAAAESRGLAAGLGELTEVQRRGFQELSGKLSEIASIIEWGFEDLKWELQQQTDVLRSIDHTLKTPSEAQANEWRRNAEEHRRRGDLDEAEKYFLRALDRYSLDYRTYIGLAETYLQMDRFDEARTYLEKSIPHAPKGSIKKALTHKPTELKAATALRKLALSDEEFDEWMKGRERGDMREDADSIRSSQTFDYKSYSYRLIGHVCACKEEFPNAVSALQSAIELSPTYYIALYDLAQYSAQTQDRETCLSVLRSVIEVDSFYFYLAQKERNFHPLSSEVGELLNEISTDASDRAKANIAKAEEMVKAAKESITKAQEALVKCRDRGAVLAPSIAAVGDAERKLNSAKEKTALGDYSAFLEATPLAKDAYNLGRKAKNGADGKPEHYENTHIKRVNKAVMTILTQIGILILSGSLGCFAFGIIGSAVGYFRADTFAEFFRGETIDDARRVGKVWATWGIFAGIAVGIVVCVARGAIRKFLDALYSYRDY